MQEKTQTNEEAKEVKDEIKPIIEEADFSKPDYTFIPKGNHIWRQEGNYIICGSCDLAHASWIGKKILVGINKDGSPMIVDRKDYEKYGFKKAKERLFYKRLGMA